MSGTVTAASADLGTFPGRGRAHPRVLEEAARRLKDEKGGLLTDAFVTRCGSTIVLLAVHESGEDATIHRLVKETLDGARAVGCELGLESADSPAEASIATLELDEAGGGLLVFMADRAGPGAWTPLLCRTLADPFTTSRLATDPAMREGFVFDLGGDRFRTPAGTYSLISALHEQGRAIARVLMPSGGSVAVTSSPAQGGSVLLGRTGGAGRPATGEWLRAAMTPLVDPNGVLLPVAVCDAFGGAGDGLPRSCCLGFQVTAGRLVGPADLFDDPAFDPVRRECLDLARLRRIQLPFETGRPRA